jgi:apolipoprotein N-acyltransferase
MIALQGLSARLRFLHGWLAGAIFIAGMQHWVADTLMDMSGFPGWLAAIGVLVYAGYVGLQWALFAFAYGPLRRWSGRRGWLFVVPLSYVLLEHLFPALFPFTLASALYEVPILLQLSEITGVCGPSWLIMLIACLVVHTYEDVARKRYSEHLMLTAGAALWLVVAVWGVVAMQEVWNAPVRGTPTIALVQPNVSIDEKKQGSAVGPFIYERSAAMTREALMYRPDLIIWPEGAFPFKFTRMSAPNFDPLNRNHRYSQKLYRLALEVGAELMVGGLRRQEGKTHNSAIHFPRTGGRVTVYDKQALVPFGEYLPGGTLTEQWRGKIKGMGNLTPGDKFQSFDALGFTWSPGICYEAILPSVTRAALNHSNADILLNFTNDVWFGDTAAAEQHLMLQIGRSIENRVWLVRATNSGISAFVDPSGTVRARSQIGLSTIMTAEIAIPALPHSFYRRYGNLWLWIASTAAFVALIFRNRRQLRNKLSSSRVQSDWVRGGNSS